MRWLSHSNGYTPDYSGYLPISSLQRGLNSLFEDVFDTTREASAQFRPKVSVVEDAKEIRLSMELAGVKKEDVKISLVEGVFTIKGEKRSEIEKSEDAHLYVERRFGSFERSFTLNADVDEDNIHASFIDGVLTVKIPKSAKAKEREKTISIK